MEHVALYLQDAHPMREGIELVRYAESKGFDAVWQADSRLVRDAVVPMAAFAATTDRIKIGSGVIDIWTRNVARLASTFSTLDDLAPGRIICGLGAWWDPLASKVGIDRDKPLRVMREVVTALRGLLNNETVTMDGHHVHLDGVELDYVHQERRPKHVPIYIGATGMQMMELTGEIADGAVLNYLVSPSYNIDAIKALTRGAVKAGRSIDDIDRPQLVVCSVDTDRKAALDASRLLVTQYLGQQPHIMKASGVPQELLDEIGKVLTWPATHDEVVAASKLVPDEIVQMITASGEPDEVRQKVDEYVANGCTCPILIGDRRGRPARPGDVRRQAIQQTGHTAARSRHLARCGLRASGAERSQSSSLAGCLKQFPETARRRSTRTGRDDRCRQQEGQELLAGNEAAARPRQRAAR